MHEVTGSSPVTPPPKTFGGFGYDPPRFGEIREQHRRCGIDKRGGLPLGHLKHEYGRASLGPKRGGDLGGIGADRDYAEPTAESTPYSGPPLLPPRCARS